MDDEETRTAPAFEGFGKQGTQTPHFVMKHTLGSSGFGMPWNSSSWIQYSVIQRRFTHSISVEI